MLLPLNQKKTSKNKSSKLGNYYTSFNGLNAKLNKKLFKNNPNGHGHRGHGHGGHIQVADLPIPTSSYCQSRQNSTINVVTFIIFASQILPLLETRLRFGFFYPESSVASGKISDSGFLQISLK